MSYHRSCSSSSSQHSPTCHSSSSPSPSSDSFTESFSSSLPKLITVTSSDGERFDIEDIVAQESVVLDYILQDVGSECPIPIPNVSSVILHKVFEYCTKYAEERRRINRIVAGYNLRGAYIPPHLRPPYVITDFDKVFIETCGEIIFDDLLKASNFLFIPGLLKLLVQSWEERNEGKTTEELLESLHLYNPSSDSSTESFSSSLPNMITVTSSDGEMFYIKDIVARESVVLNSILQDLGSECSIPITNVSSVILHKVFEYCTKYAEERRRINRIVAGYNLRGAYIPPHLRPPYVITDFDKVFIETCGEIIFDDLLKAANFLFIPGLLKLLVQSWEERNEGKTTEDLLESLHSTESFSSSLPNMITVTSSDGEMFYIEDIVARESVVLNSILQDLGSECSIPITNVSSVILHKVFEYCTKYAEERRRINKIVAGYNLRGSYIPPHLRPPYVITDFDKLFIETCGESIFNDLVKAAKFLFIPGLLKLLLQTWEEHNEGKTGKDLLKYLHLDNGEDDEEPVYPGGLPFQITPAELEELNLMYPCDGSWSR